VADGSVDGNGGPEASLDDATQAEGGVDATVADASGGDVGLDGSIASSDAEGGSATVSLEGLVLLLHMDEPSWSGPASVKDSSPMHNNGTPQGTAATTPNGKFGGAGLFDGKGFVIVPNADSLQPTQAITCTAWVYPTGLVPSNWPYPAIVAKRLGDGISVSYTMFLWTYNQLFGDINGARYKTDAGISNDEWVHLAVVFDSTAPSGQQVQLYINGVVSPAPENALQDPGAMLGPSDADLTVGYLPQGTLSPPLDPNGLFVGRIDEVAIWGRALSQAEITALVNATGPL
jgi:hypothetical protein